MIKLPDYLINSKGDEMVMQLWINENYPGKGISIDRCKIGLNADLFCVSGPRGDVWLHSAGDTDNEGTGMYWTSFSSGTIGPYGGEMKFNSAGNALKRACEIVLKGTFE